MTDTEPEILIENTPARMRSLRECAFAAAETYPLALERPAGCTWRTDAPWDPAAYTMSWIRADLPLDSLSDSDCGSLHAILDRRVQDAKDERDAEKRKGSGKRRGWLGTKEPDA